MEEESEEIKLVKFKKKKKRVEKSSTYLTKKRT
jgi:hypothetical protein